MKKNTWISVTHAPDLEEGNEIDIFTSGTGERKTDAVWTPEYDEEGDLDGGFFTVIEEFNEEDYSTNEVTHFMIVELPKQ
jgi:hypothetical protein